MATGRCAVWCVGSASWWRRRARRRWSQRWRSWCQRDSNASQPASAVISAAILGRDGAPEKEQVALPQAAKQDASEHASALQGGQCVQAQSRVRRVAGRLRGRGCVPSVLLACGSMLHKCCRWFAAFVVDVCCGECAQRCIVTRVRQTSQGAADGARGARAQKRCRVCRGV